MKVVVDLRYIISIGGLTKAIGVILGVLICGCVAHGLCYQFCTGTNFDQVGANGQKYVIAVGATTSILTFVLFVLHLLRIPEVNEQFNAIPWNFMEFGYFLLGAGSFLFAASIETWYAANIRMDYKSYDSSAWLAASVFCFLNFGNYAFSSFLAWRISGMKCICKFYVRKPSGSNSSGNPPGNSSGNRTRPSNRQPPQTIDI